MAAKGNSKTLQYVKKNFKLMVVIKALGSLLAQIGLWHAGETPVVSVVVLPLIIIFVGFLIIDKKINEQRAQKMAKYMRLFYAILILAVVGNIFSFLIKMGFFTTVGV